VKAVAQIGTKLAPARDDHQASRRPLAERSLSPGGSERLASLRWCDRTTSEASASF